MCPKDGDPPITVIRVHSDCWICAGWVYFPIAIVVRRNRKKNRKKSKQLCIAMPGLIGIGEFVDETKEDYHSPTTSTFVSRMSECRQTINGLEEVHWCIYIYNIHMDYGWTWGSFVRLTRTSAGPVGPVMIHWCLYCSISHLLPYLLHWQGASLLAHFVSIL